MSGAEVGVAALEREAMLELLERLIAIDSVTGNEAPLARFLAEWFEAHGIETRLLPCKDRFNVWAQAGRGERTLVLSGHLDTVPPNSGAWPASPWSPRREGGRVHGLGASDLKGALAAACFALLRWRAAPGDGRLACAFTIEEETSGDGTKAFVTEAVASGLLDPARTAALVMEPTGLEHVSLGNRGTCFFVVRAKGRGGHGSRPHLARNPIDALRTLLDALPRLVARWNEESDAHGFPKATLTPTSIHAGSPDAKNVVPEEASLVLDFRATPGLWADDFAGPRAAFAAFLRELAIPGVVLEHEVVHARPGHVIAEDHPLVRTAVATLDTMGRQVRLVRTPAGNDAAFLAQAGIPTLNKFGPGEPEWAHRADESIPETNVVLYLEFLDRFARAWLSG